VVEVLPELCACRFAATTAEGAIRELSRRLHVRGLVRASFEGAAVLRERRSPTGLPFEGGAVALPHADPEHVVLPAIAALSAEEPIVFLQMGSPSVKLQVKLVVMPAFANKEQAGGALSALVVALRDEATRRAIADAPTPEAMSAALARVVAR
jgi:PTS system galactitol-specific IIA component